MSTMRKEPLTRGSPGRPSRAGFWLAGAVAALGAAAAVFWAIAVAVSAAGGADDLDRGDVPGTVTTAVTEPGTVLVYYEGDPVPSLDQLALRVTGPDGDSVPVRAYELELRYDSPAAPGTVGTAVATFDARQPGTFRVDTPFLPRAQAWVAVGEDIGTGFVQTLVGPAALAAASLALALGIALVTALRINAYYRRTSPGSGP